MLIGNPIEPLKALNNVSCIERKLGVLNQRIPGITVGYRTPEGSFTLAPDPDWNMRLLHRTRKNVTSSKDT
ncbi:MAG: hypothetical protein CM1200mP18_23510 [Gammaproteobacteria bacterium]|nr:MAG: hypothetical protein CM1200mP18_23510 [Gammaproteobacteria bacterium]